MKINKLLVCLMATIPSLSFALGSLENPVAGSTESGIGAISGWHCTASNITVTIDGGSLGKAGSGTSRNDTASICGRSDTGYSLLFNYNDLTPGSHTISVHADGQLLETRQFNTVQSGGSAFVTGISKKAFIFDFPSFGRTATLQWTQAKQSFVVTEIVGGENSAVDLPSLQGTYSLTLTQTVSGNGCADVDQGNGTETIPFIVTTSGNAVTFKASDGNVNGDFCTLNTAYFSGNSASGFNLTGNLTCSYDSTLAGVTFRSLRKTDNQLHGNFALTYPGCVATNSF